MFSEDDSESLAKGCVEHSIIIYEDGFVVHESNHAVRMADLVVRLFRNDNQPLDFQEAPKLVTKAWALEVRIFPVDLACHNRGVVEAHDVAAIDYQFGSNAVEIEQAGAVVGADVRMILEIIRRVSENNESIARQLDRHEVAHPDIL